MLLVPPVGFEAEADPEVDAGDEVCDWGALGAVADGSVAEELSERLEMELVVEVELTEVVNDEDASVVEAVPVEVDVELPDVETVEE